MFPILATVLEVSEEGVKIGSGSLIFAVLPVLLSLVIPVLIIYYFFYRKRLEHKQILAAIEKGMSLSELRAAKSIGPAWIKNLTAGIALLIIAAGIVCMRLAQGYDYDEKSFGFLVFALIFFAIGVSRLLRGLLQRRAEKQTKILKPNTQSPYNQKGPRLKIYQ